MYPLQPAPQVKVEPLGSRSLNAGERLGNVKPELGMAQDYSLMAGHSGSRNRSMNYFLFCQTLQFNFIVSGKMIAKMTYRCEGHKEEGRERGRV